MPNPFTSPVSGDMAMNAVMPMMHQQPQMQQPQSQGRPGTVNLATMIYYTTQKAYTDLMRLAEILPAKTDMERKVEIAQYLNNVRLMLIRLDALTKWANSVGKVEKCERISDYLNRQSEYFTETANDLSIIARETLVGARLPVFAVVLAIDILTKRTYARLPTCLKERIVPSNPVSNWEKIECLTELNHLIQYRLGSSQMPLQMRQLVVSDGRVTFTVPNEFQLTLTLMSEAMDYPWRILDIKVLVEDTEIGGGRSLVHSQQLEHLHRIAQMRIYDKDSDHRPPLVHLYDMMHDFCLSLQLDLIHEQTLRLMHTRTGELLSVENYQPGHSLTVAYWRDLVIRERDRRRPSVCTVTIHVDPSDHRRPLAVSHSPALPSTGEARRIVAALRSPRPSMERLLDRCVEVRSRARLQKLRMELMCVCPGPLPAADVPLCLLVPPLYPCLDHERIRVHVDPHRGTFCVNMSPGSGHTPSGGGESNDCPHLSVLQVLLNSEDRTRKKMMDTFGLIRVWLGLRRAVVAVQHLALQTCTQLPFVRVQEHPVWNIINEFKQHVFIRLLKFNPLFLLVVPKECGLELRYTFFLLSAVNCTPSGVANPSGRFLRPGHLRALRTESVLNINAGARLNDSISCHKEINSAWQQRKRTALILESLPHDASHEAVSARLLSPPTSKRRRRIDGSAMEIAAPEIENPVVAGGISGLAHFVAMAEDYAMLSAMMEKMECAGMRHSSVQLDAAGSLSALSIISFGREPMSEPNAASPSNSLSESVGDNLRRLCSSCTVRAQRKHPRCWQVDWVFEKGNPLPVAASPDDEDSNSRRALTVTRIYPMGPIGQLSNVISEIQADWRALCAMHDACSDLEEAENLPNGVKIKSYDLKNLTISYGPDYAYMAGITYRRNEEAFTLCLGGVGQYEHLPNPHTIIRDIVQKELNQHRCVRTFICTLLETLPFAQCLSRVRGDLVLMQASGAQDLRTASLHGSIGGMHLARPFNLIQLSAHVAILVFRNRFALRIAYSPRDDAVELEDAHRMFATCEPMPSFEKFLECVRKSSSFVEQAVEKVKCVPLSLLEFLLNSSSEVSGSVDQQKVNPLERYLVSAYFYKYLESLCRNDVLFRETLNSKQLEVMWSSSQPGSSVHRLQLLSDGICFDFCFGPVRPSYDGTSWGIQLTASERGNGANSAVGNDPFGQNDQPNGVGSWTNDQLSTLGRYFTFKVVDATPTRSQALVGFLRLLCLPTPVLRDLSHVMQLEMGGDVPDANHHISLALVTMVPHHTIGNNVAQLGSPAILLRPPFYDIHFGITSLKSGLTHYFYLRYNREQNAVQLLKCQPISASATATHPTAGGSADVFNRLNTSLVAERVNQSGGINKLYNFFSYLIKFQMAW